MFTIKATYRTETRKFSLDIDQFPSFDQLYSQLYRLFPISNNYYLSKLLFSPVSNSPSRILISREVHSEEEYDACVRPYLGQTYTNALLRFSVYDETPHKVPSVSSFGSSIYAPSPPEFPPISFAHIPPPPIIFSATPPMDVDTDTPSFGPYTSSTQQPTRANPCCNVSQAKADIEKMIGNFSTDLATVLTNTFGTSKTPETVVQPTSSTSAFDTSMHGLGYMPAYVPTPTSQSAPLWTNFSTSSAQFLKETPRPASDERLPPTEGASTRAAQHPPSVIHSNVVCDRCDQIVVGVRHKCMDCPDYDLCEECFAQNSEAVHNPFHEFIDIKEPGRVIVHRVYSGRGERDAAPTPTAAPSSNAAETIPALHLASCDLCENHIVGERYKCTVCPDFDTCSGCFGITSEQHPGHSFIRISEPSDFILRHSQIQPRHYASCDGCRNTIYGIRYKCMHPDCPDFDLCEGCEAHPIPMHNPRHAMLKIRSPNAPISHPSATFINPPVVARVPTLEVLPVPDVPVLPSTEKSVDVAVTTDDVLFDKLKSSWGPNGELLNTPPTRTISINQSPAKGEEDIWERFEREAKEEAERRKVEVEVHERRMEDLREELQRRVENERKRLSQQDAVAQAEVNTGDEGAAETESAPWLNKVDPEKKLESDDKEAPLTTNRLADLLRGLEFVTRNEEEIKENDSAAVSSKSSNDVAERLLNAALADDVTKQTFPPGAEFVKSWRMRNNGNVAWPESTELVWVAGDLQPKSSSTQTVHVGKLEVGEETEIATDDMKAPEVPNRYVGYWRLKDGEGNLFGQSVWVDIVVAEANSSSASEGSIGSSSIMVMPNAAPTAMIAADRSIANTTTSSTRTRSDDDVPGSIGRTSSIDSLVSLPSSSAFSEYADAGADILDEFLDAGEGMNRETASVGSNAMEYVLLYEDDSSEEE